MGSIIEASAMATAAEHQRSMSTGALELADAAIRSCLTRADRTAAELDLLINAGVFHDKILSEPAFASLIQEDIGANLSHPAGAGAAAGHGTFSFDVYNGACGLLTGIHLIDGMLASGTVKLGMVVASDMDPEPGVSVGFAFPGVGGAVLLSADDSRAGFTAFEFATFPEFAELFESYVAWQDDSRGGPDGYGRNTLTVEIAGSYVDSALECAEPTVRKLAAAEALDFDEVDVLVATASVPGFADRLATRLGISTDRTASLPEDLVGAHTAAPAVALESLGIAAGTTALFVCAGAGITVAVALYRG
jgi:3-oxoacyl-[acyl-carrier-protein] synthase-3